MAFDAPKRRSGLPGAFDSNSFWSINIYLGACLYTGGDPRDHRQFFTKNFCLRISAHREEREPEEVRKSIAPQPLIAIRHPMARDSIHR